MFLLAKDVVFVPGAYCGAIYDFNTNDVYSINHDTCILLQNLKLKNFFLNNEQKEYIELLINNNLYDANYFGKPINFKKPKFTNFETVWFELTMGCNCRCLHCYEGNVHQKLNNSLTIEKWFNIVDQVQKLGVKKIILIGGEPCLFKDIIKLIEKIKSYNIDIVLFTNATIINDEIMSTIIKNNVKVKVSIYGHNANIHDKITQHVGSFNKMCSNIKYLKEQGVNVIPSVIIMKENQDYIKEIKEFITNLGLIWNGYDIVREIGCGKNDKHVPDNGLLKTKYRTEPSFIASKDFFIDSLYFNNCWKNKIVISENGDVLPCVFARNELCGNINQSSIKKIVNNNLIKYWNYDLSNVDICKDCEFRFACKDCRPVAMSISGKLSAHTQYCKYNPYKGEWGG